MTERKDLITYIGTAPQLDGSLTWCYDLGGVLRVFENNTNISDGELIKFIATRLPMKEDWHSYLMHRFREEKGITLHIDRIEVDLSFESIWNFYDKKQGNKKRAEEIWTGTKPTNSGKMTEADKVKTFKMLPRMKFQYKITNKEMPYLETFLSQRRFENEF